jgi:adenylate cyclase class IV
MYEIEQRAVLNKDSYEVLRKALEARATNLGSDDKKVSYYIFSDKLLKIVHNVSKQSAKISLKLNTLGNGSLFEELEVSFDEDSLEKMKRICSAVSNPLQIIDGTQKRTNFAYEGVEIALKWSEDWGYHVEFEILIQDLTKKEAADLQIEKIAKEFSITLMTEKEVADFSANVRAKNKFKKA